MGVYGQTGTPITGSPPACRVYRSTSQSINDNTSTTVTFDAEVFDTDTMHDLVTNTSRITIRTAGVYLVTFTGYFAAGADYTEFYADIYKNGFFCSNGQSGSATTDSAARRMKTQDILKLAVNDYLEIVVYQNNGANTARNLTADGAGLPAFAAMWLGLGT